MIVVIDNYDSFTYNLVQYLGELGQEIEVFRNDAISAEEVAKLGPDHVVVSPGPKRPEDARVSNDVIQLRSARFQGSDILSNPGLRKRPTPR